MVGLFERLFGKSEQNDKSGKLAKDRLQFVLVQDRINLPSEKMQQMQKEIIEVISKYVAVDMEKVDFALSNRDRSGLLIAEIPFKHAIKDDDNAADADEAEPDVRVSVAASTDKTADEAEGKYTPSDDASPEDNESTGKTTPEISADASSTDGDGDSSDD
ncbi:MAG: cell division topological specificity factor MinE [Chloroflexota bacterium]